MKTVRVVAAVIRDGDRIFATARGYGEYKGWWEFPGGKIEAGETPEEALVREIHEELDTEILAGGEGTGGLRLRHQPRSILPQRCTDLRQIMTGK